MTDSKTIEEKIKEKESELELLTLLMWCEEFPGNLRLVNFSLDIVYPRSFSLDVVLYSEFEGDGENKKHLIKRKNFKFDIEYFKKTFSDLFNSFGIIDSRIIEIDKIEHQMSRLGEDAERAECQAYLFIENLEGEEITSVVQYRQLKYKLQGLIDAIAGVKFKDKYFNK